MVENPITPETNPQGEGAEFEKIMRRLESGERVELLPLPATPAALSTLGTLNLAVKNDGGVTKVRSGGFEVQIMDNSIIVFNKEKEPVHVYTGRCLVLNVRKLLYELLLNYNYKLEDKWTSIRLPRSDVKVRRLQSWILALINGFNVPLHDSPLVC